MKFILLITAFIITSLSFAQILETEKGLKHTFYTNNKGALPKIGDLVSLHMRITDAKGAVIRNSFSEGKPILFPLKYPHFEADIYEAVALMSEGDSADFWVNADSMYQKIFRKPFPETMTHGSDLKVTIKTLKIRSQRAYKEEQTSFYNSNLKESPEVIAKRKKKEEAQIQEYIKKSGFQFTKTTKGTYYSIVEKKLAQDNLPKENKAVVFNYIGQLIDGTVFESSYKDIGHSITFTIGSGEVIEGWDDAFRNIPNGAKAKIIIPSHLGYGNITKDKIPANAILIFDVHLVAIY